MPSSYKTCNSNIICPKIGTPYSIRLRPVFTKVPKVTAAIPAASMVGLSAARTPAVVIPPVASEVSAALTVVKAVTAPAAQALGDISNLPKDKEAITALVAIVLNDVVTAPKPEVVVPTHA